MSEAEKIEKRKRQIKAANARWNAKHRTDYMRLYRLNGYQEKERARARELRVTDPDMALAKDRAKREADRDGCRRRTRAWQAKNRERIKVYAEWYAKTFPEKRKASYKNAQAQRRGAIGKYTVKDIERIRIAQRNRCAYCRSVTDELHIDHIIPIARGGTNWPANIQLACPSCNMRKKAKLPEAFAREMGMLV
jgi:5-methylcytosine-specific restriction endonuclease McrA